MTVLHNPTEAAVKDYPIRDGEEVKLWSILPGETLGVPDSVGKYLLEVYGFLQEVVTEDQHRERLEEKKKVQEGRVYSQVKIVKAEGEVIDPPSPQTGFTNQNMQPHGAEVAKPPVSNVGPTTEDFPFQCPETGCGQKFRTEKLIKTHYSLKHLELPKGA